MPYLRGSGGMVAVLVLIGEVVRLRRLCEVHLLHLGERFAHPSERHGHLILRPLRLTVGLYQAVKVVVSVIFFFILLQSFLVSLSTYQHD